MCRGYGHYIITLDQSISLRFKWNVYEAYSQQYYYVFLINIWIFISSLICIESSYIPMMKYPFLPHRYLIDYILSSNSFSMYFNFDKLVNSLIYTLIRHLMILKVNNTI